MYNPETDLNRDKLVEIDKTESPDDIIMKCIRNIITVLGDDPDREGLVETPKRVMNMYKEVYEGMRYSNEEIATMFDKCFEDVQTGDLVVETNIPVFSNCEHHLALMYDVTIAIGYIPKGKVIGLSKLARISDMVAKRLQLQERIGMDIADILEMVLGTEDIIVVIEGKHGCMTSRGIKSREAITKTATLRGRFNTDSELRSEFYSLIK
jgi:GTP cyclohydrolase I